MNDFNPPEKIPEFNKITQVVRKIEQLIDNENISINEFGQIFMNFIYHAIVEKGKYNRSEVIALIHSAHEDMINIAEHDPRLQGNRN